MNLLTFPRLAFVYPCLLTLGITGCNCGGPPAGADGGEAPRCVVDPERIAERPACISDDTCPCGTHCELGVCEATCSGDEECASGQRCDGFGRCRYAAASTLVPDPPRQTKQGAARMLEAVTQVDPTTGEGVLRVEILGGEESRARLRAELGVLIQCPEVGWATECLLSKLAAGSVTELPVKLGSDLGTVGTVSVTTETSRSSVTIQRLPPLKPAPTPFSEVPLSGLYRGVAAAEGFGYLNDAGISDDVPAEALSIPLTARLYGDPTAATLVLASPYSPFGAGELVGTFSLADGDGNGVFTGSASFPARQLHLGNIGDGFDFSLASQMIAAEVSVVDEPRAVTLALTQAMPGLGPSLTPTVSWRVSLAREGSVTDAAPTVPADFLLPVDPATLAQTPTPWEVATDAVMGSFASLSDPEKAERFGFLFGRYGLDSCTDLSGSGNVGPRVWLGLWPGVGGSKDRGGQGGPPPTSMYARNEPLVEMVRDRMVFDTGVSDLLSMRINSVSLGSSFPSGRDLEAGRIPCNANFYQGSIPNVGSFASFGREAWFNNCTALVEATGCRLQYVDTGTSREARHTVVMEVAYLQTGNPTPQVVTVSAIVNVRWFVECVLPEPLPHCATSSACWAPSSDETPASVRASEWGDSLGFSSGELACASGGRSGAIELDARADTGTTPPTAAEAVSLCESDLDDAFGAPPATAARYAKGLTALSGSAGCFSPARLIPALHDGLAAGRMAQPSDAKLNAAGAYGARLASRWLTAHAFLAAEAIQRDGMAAALGGTNPLDLGKELETSLRGWDLLLHPRFANLLGQLPAHLLAQPDYRQYAAGLAGRVKDPQRVGLPAVMMDALSRQAELLALLVEKGSLKANQTVTQRLGEVMPRWLAARALAGALRQRSGLAGGAVDWADRYVGAERRFVGQYNSALAHVQAIEQGRNPLGIEEEDLPLYFLADDPAGPGGRFSAISDFLLGTGPSSNAWAPALVRQAKEALTAARAEYQTQADRAYLVAREQTKHTAWVEEVRASYNQTLRDFCGPVTESLVDDPQFTAARCAINTALSKCTNRAAEWFLSWTPADVSGRFCVEEQTRRALGEKAGFADPAVLDFAKRCRATSAGGPRIVSCGEQACLECSTSAGSERVPLRHVGALSFRGSPQLNVPVVGHFKQMCRIFFPGMRETPPLTTSVLEIPGCVRGSIGEAYLDIVTANRDLQAANAQYTSFTDAYKIAVESCNALASSVDQKKQLREAHERNMLGLVAGKAAADSAAAAAGGMKDCMATVAQSDKSNPFSAIASAAGAVGTCVAAGAEVAATITSTAIGAHLENVQRQHETALADLDEGTEVKRCYIEARLNLVGLKNAQLAIEQAAFDLQRAQSHVTELLAEAQRTWAEGHEYVREIEVAPAPPPSGDQWVAEYVSTYIRRFRLARRATYLAVRAVEYELQQSLGQRSQVLGAENPDQLEAVLADLWTTAGTRTLNGSRPSDLHSVLSLKNDVLRVSDASRVPPELQPLTPEERFRILLKSPQYAIYDGAGRYEGQRIPFSLSALETLGFSSDGVAIHAKRDCAERLWAVNASVIGQDVLEGTESSLIRLDLLKRDVFSSQWCGQAPSGEPLQTVSVRPTRNLFREPGLGTSVGTNFGTDQQTTGWSRARIQAFLNVEREKLEDPSYANGETSELAARGLYGEYALFIPGELIAQETPSGAYTTGLVFDRVDDILLRVDYVSVAR